MRWPAQPWSKTSPPLHAILKTPGWLCHSRVSVFDAIVWQVFILRNFDICEIILAKILARLITARNHFVWSFCKLYNCDMSLQKLGYLTQASRVTPPWSFTWENSYKTSPHLGGLPASAERVTRPGGVPHLSCKRYQDKRRLYMNRRITPLCRVTSPTWGPPPPCKQALTFHNSNQVLIKNCCYGNGRYTTCPPYWPSSWIFRKFYFTQNCSKFYWN